MELNKLEQDFKKKLNERTIQPSEMSWDRLDAMLSVAEKKSKPKKRTWLYIAASFLGFLLVGTIFFKQPEVEIQTAKEKGVVVQEKTTEKQVEAITADEYKTKSSNQITTAAAGAIASRLPEQKKVQKIKSSAVSQEDKTSQVMPEKTEAIATVEQKETVKANKYIESEKLLAEAENKIQSQSVKKYVAKSNVKVDSKGLLSDVEGELNESFRNRVIKSIGRNYESVKTSLANRNNE